jgi:hypothetical protein
MSDKTKVLGTCEYDRDCAPHLKNYECVNWTPLPDPAAPPVAQPAQGEPRAILLEADHGHGRLYYAAQIDGQIIAQGLSHKIAALIVDSINAAASPTPEAAPPSDGPAHVRKDDDPSEAAATELPDWCKFPCPTCHAVAGHPCVNGASCMARVLLQGLAEPAQGEPTTLSGKTREEWHAHIDNLFGIAFPGENLSFNVLYAWTGKPTPQQIEEARKIAVELEASPTPEAAATELPPQCNVIFNDKRCWLDEGHATIYHDFDGDTVRGKLCAALRELAALREFWDTALSQSVGLRYNYETKIITNERAQKAEAERDALQAKLEESEKKAAKYLEYHDRAIGEVAELRAKLERGYVFDPCRGTDHSNCAVTVTRRVMCSCPCHSSASAQAEKAHLASEDAAQR